MKTTVALAVTFAVIVALLVVIVRQARPGAGGLPIGYVSMQRILSESPQEKASASRLTQLQQQKSQAIATLQREYEANRRQLSQVQGLSSSAKQAELEKEEQRLRTELEKTSAQAQTELQALQRQVQGDLRTRLTPIMEGVARSRGVQIVLTEEAGVLWATPGLDLTNAVLERLKVEVRSPAPK